jgi:hypothetical protein
MSSSLYKSVDIAVTVENPYDTDGIFKIKIIESKNPDGIVYNPYYNEKNQNQEPTKQKTNQSSFEHNQTAIKRDKKET